MNSSLARKPKQGDQVERGIARGSRELLFRPGHPELKQGAKNEYDQEGVGQFKDHSNLGGNGDGIWSAARNAPRSPFPTRTGADSRWQTTTETDCSTQSAVAQAGNIKAACKPGI
jgi:hypothetical protein